MSLQIAHVVRQYHPALGGMEDVVCNLAQRQRQTYGHRTRVITLDRVFRQKLRLPHDEVFNDIPITRLPYFGSERYPFCPSILKHLADADVIHVHGIDFFYDFLAFTHWRHQRPLIASTHGGFFHTPFAQALKRIFFHTVTRASSQAYQRVIATSANDGDMFADIVDGDRLTVIENGVDIEKFSGAASPERHATLIYFGRWSENKGLPESLQLLQLLRERDPDSNWSLIVTGREFDYTAAHLREMAAALNIADAVELVVNPNNAEIRELIGRASYFISLSRHEGFGLAAVEAMSAGLIPLLGPIPPYAKLAIETGAPLLLPNTLRESAAAILELHATDNKAYQQRKHLAQEAAANFGWPSVVDRYEREYERACALHTNPAESFT